MVAQTNRRPYGFDWQDWGRLDFLEVYDFVIQNYSIDLDRVYLAGGSMGGQGTWHIGLHHPSLFAALAPQAGWSTLHIYQPFAMQRSLMFASPKVLLARERARNDSNNLYFLQNLEHLPVFVTQGAKDKIVPPLHPRLFQKLIKELDYEFQYRELAEKGHWWDDPISKGGGSDALDNDELMLFLKGKSREKPDSFRVRIYDLSLNDTFYWIKVLVQKKPMTNTMVNARILNNYIFLKTENVASLKVDLRQIKKQIKWIDWNGSLTPINGKEQVVLGRVTSDTLEETLGMLGSFKSVFFEPFVIVYGTLGDEEQEEGMLHSANAIAYRFYRFGNGYTRIMADSEVDPSIMEHYNLILLGSSQNNALTAELLSQTPAVVGKRYIQLDNLRFEGDLSLAMLYPNPRFPKKIVAFLTGNSVDSERRALFFLPIFVSFL